MASMNRRIDHIESALPPAPAPSPSGTLGAILAALSPRYRHIVEADLAAGPTWWPAGGTTRRLTMFVLEMAHLSEIGMYTGRLAFPDSVCKTMLDTYATSDRRLVAQSGDYHPNNFPAADECDVCGWVWWSPTLRDELEHCPGCDVRLTSERPTERLGVRTRRRLGIVTA